MNLHTDGYESVVDDGAVTKIDFVAFAGLPDFMGERLQVTMASLQIGLCGLGISEGGHGVPFKQVIAPETAHFWNGQLLELSGCPEQGSEQGSEQSQKGQQDPERDARKGSIAKRPQSPQEGFTVFAALLVVTVVFCYHFCSWLS